MKRFPAVRLPLARMTKTMLVLWPRQLIQGSKRCLWNQNIRDNLMSGVYALAALVAYGVIDDCNTGRSLDRQAWRNYQLSRVDEHGEIAQAYVDVVARNRREVAAIMYELRNASLLDDAEYTEQETPDRRNWATIQMSFQQLRDSYNKDCPSFVGPGMRLRLELAAMKNEAGLSTQVAGTLRPFADEGITASELCEQLFTVWFGLGDIKTATLMNACDEILQLYETFTPKAGAGGLIAIPTTQSSNSLGNSLDPTHSRKNRIESLREIKKRLLGEPDVMGRFVIARELSDHIREAISDTSAVAAANFHMAASRRIDLLLNSPG